MKKNKSLTWTELKEQFPDWREYFENSIPKGIHEVELMCTAYGKNAKAGLHIFLFFDEKKHSLRMPFWDEKYSYWKVIKFGSKLKIEFTNRIISAEIV